MCGIAGLYVKNRSEDFLTKISDDLKQIVFCLIKESSSRGKDAAGYCLVNNDEIKIKKGNRSANYLMPTTFNQGTSDYEKEFVSTLFETNFHTALIHCRAATKGTADENINNHPIIRGDIIGVHNGTIDDRAVEELRKIIGVEKKADVDSAIIFETLNMINVRDKKKMIFILNRFIEYAIAFIHIKHDLLFLSRDSSDKRKLFYINTPDIFIFAQEEDILRSATVHSKYIKQVNEIKDDVRDFEAKKSIHVFDSGENALMVVSCNRVINYKTRNFSGGIFDFIIDLLIANKNTDDVLNLLDIEGILPICLSSLSKIIGRDNVMAIESAEE